MISQQQDLDTFGNFNAFRSSKPSLEAEKWSEADTRSKLIDRLLTDCLGWPENSIRRELTAKNERLDYLLSVDKPILVVEAKKHSLSFAIPPRKSYYGVKIDSLLKANPSLTDDVDQVHDYCTTWSVPYAALTNGKQLIVFAAFRYDGKPWRDGEAHVFYDLFGHYDYVSIFNLLAYDAYKTNQIFTSFYELPPIDRASSTLSMFSRPNATIPHNELGVAIEPVLRTAFTDAVSEDSDEILEHCYVYPAESKIRDDELEALLLDRKPVFDTEISDLDSKNSFVRFGERLQDYLQIDKPAQIVFLIGGIGVGKSMFINRFFRISADETLRRKTTYLYVDFRNPTTDPTKVDQLILQKLRATILDLHGKPIADNEGNYDFESSDALEQIFWPQMQRFKTGPEGELKEIDPVGWEKSRLARLCFLREDDLQFIRGAVRILKQRYHRYVVVIIDNADVCTEDYQRAVYLYARTLLQELKAPLVVALREEWYWHFNRGGGPGSAFQDMVFHVPCPRARDVLVKRLDYSIQLMESRKTSRPKFHLYGMTVEAESIVKYLNVLKAGLVESEEVGSFYECYANRSVRRGLDTFLDFVRSGHTEAETYLKALIIDGRYRIAFHQFFKSVTRCNYAYYSEVNSRLPNVYQLEGRVHRSHFHRLNLLRYLYNQRKFRSPLGDGFINTGVIKEFLDQTGLSEDSIRTLLAYLLETEVIESDIRRKTFADNTQAYRVTVLGGLLSEKLYRSWEYLEATMLDTRITDPGLRQHLLEAFKEGKRSSIEQRVPAVAGWIRYLQRQEEQELAGRKGCYIYGLQPIGPALQAAFTREEERILRSAARKKSAVRR
jgi:hypothetical protein